MMKKILNRKKINPSEPAFTGVKHEDELSLQEFKYNAEECLENPDYAPQDFQGFQETEHQCWLNIHGLHDVNTIRNICVKTGVHDLAIQDILDVNQRPKFQEYETYWFFTLKSILPANNSIIEQEQLSFILGSNFLISFQERKADYFNHIRQRLRNDEGIVRERGTDYLLFLLLESILDNYVKTINGIDGEIEKLGLIESDVDPSPSILKTIELYKRQIHQIKKTILPLKEYVSKIEREKTGFVQKKHLKYFYELRDLSLTLIDECDYLEVQLESSINLFFSVQGHRMNQVMKTLTTVATIFIPLTFLAGIYGMNFSHMPELDWKLGYLGFWLVILLVFILLLAYFKKKKWF